MAAVGVVERLRLGARLRRPGVQGCGDLDRHGVRPRDEGHEDALAVPIRVQVHGRVLLEPLRVRLATAS